MPHAPHTRMGACAWAGGDGARPLVVERVLEGVVSLQRAASSSMHPAAGACRRHCSAVPKKTCHATGSDAALFKWRMSVQIYSRRSKQRTAQHCTGRPSSPPGAARR